jgi:hypothetical protein
MFVRCTMYLFVVVMYCTVTVINLVSCVSVSCKWHFVADNG